MHAPRARRRVPTPACWLLLALLALGMVLQPVLAAACEIADVAAAVAIADSGDAGHADAVDDSAGAAITAADDCCDSGNCVDCCLHAVAHPVHDVALAEPVFAATPPQPRAHAPPPRAWPVAIRPPIAG